MAVKVPRHERDMYMDLSDTRASSVELDVSDSEELDFSTMNGIEPYYQKQPGSSTTDQKVPWFQWQTLLSIILFSMIQGIFQICRSCSGGVSFAYDCQFVVISECYLSFLVCRVILLGTRGMSHIYEDTREKHQILHFHTQRQLQAQ